MDVEQYLRRRRRSNKGVWLVVAALFLATCCVAAVMVLWPALGSHAIQRISRNPRIKAECREWMRVNDPSCQVAQFSKVVVTKEEPQWVAKHPFEHHFGNMLEGNLGPEAKSPPPQPKTETVYTIYGRIGFGTINPFGGWHETRLWRFRKDYTLWYTMDQVGHRWPGDE